jgi:hypothetical protein
MQHKSFLVAGAIGAVLIVLTPTYLFWLGDTFAAITLGFIDAMIAAPLVVLAICVIRPSEGA